MSPSGAPGGGLVFSSFSIFHRKLGSNDEAAGLRERAERLLYFYPHDFPALAQLRHIGFCEGLIDFSRAFNQDSPLEVVNLNRRRYFLSEVEPDVWVVLVLKQQTQAGESDLESCGLRIDRTLKDPSDGAVLELLRKLYDCYCLFYGSATRVLGHAGCQELITALNGLRAEVRSLREKRVRTLANVAHAKNAEAAARLRETAAELRDRLLAATSQSECLQACDPVMALRYSLRAYFDFALFHTDFSRPTLTWDCLPSLWSLPPPRDVSVSLAICARDVSRRCPSVSRVVVLFDGCVVYDFERPKPHGGLHSPTSSSASYLASSSGGRRGGGQPDASATSASTALTAAGGLSLSPNRVLSLLCSYLRMHCFHVLRRHAHAQAHSSSSSGGGRDVAAISSPADGIVSSKTWSSVLRSWTAAGSAAGAGTAGQVGGSGSSSGASVGAGASSGLLLPFTPDTRSYAFATSYMRDPDAQAAAAAEGTSSLDSARSSNDDRGRVIQGGVVETPSGGSGVIERGGGSKNQPVLELAQFSVFNAGKHVYWDRPAVAASTQPTGSTARHRPGCGCSACAIIGLPLTSARGSISGPSTGGHGSIPPERTASAYPVMTSSSSSALHSAVSSAATTPVLSGRLGTVAEEEGRMSMDPDARRRSSAAAALVPPLALNRNAKIHSSPPPATPSRPPRHNGSTTETLVAGAGNMDSISGLTDSSNAASAGTASEGACEGTVKKLQFPPQPQQQSVASSPGAPASPASASASRQRSSSYGGSPQKLSSPLLTLSAAGGYRYNISGLNGSGDGQTGKPRPPPNPAAGTGLRPLHTIASNGANSNSSSSSGGGGFSASASSFFQSLSPVVPRSAPHTPRGTRGGPGGAGNGFISSLYRGATATSGSGAEATPLQKPLVTPVKTGGAAGGGGGSTPVTGGQESFSTPSAGANSKGGGDGVGGDHTAAARLFGLAASPSTPQFTSPLQSQQAFSSPSGHTPGMSRARAMLEAAAAAIATTPSSPQANVPQVVRSQLPMIPAGGGAGGTGSSLSQQQQQQLNRQQPQYQPQHQNQRSTSRESSHSTLSSSFNTARLAGQAGGAPLHPAAAAAGTAGAVSARLGGGGSRGLSEPPSQNHHQPTSSAPPQLLLGSSSSSFHRGPKPWPLGPPPLPAAAAARRCGRAVVTVEPSWPALNVPYVTASFLDSLPGVLSGGSSNNNDGGTNLSARAISSDSTGTGGGTARSGLGAALAAAAAGGGGGSLYEPPGTPGRTVIVGRQSAFISAGAGGRGGSSSVPASPRSSTSSATFSHSALLAAAAAGGGGGGSNGSGGSTVSTPRQFSGCVGPVLPPPLSLHHHHNRTGSLPAAARIAASAAASDLGSAPASAAASYYRGARAIDSPRGVSSLASAAGAGVRKGSFAGPVTTTATINANGRHLPLTSPSSSSNPVFCPPIFTNPRSPEPSHRLMWYQHGLTSLLCFVDVTVAAQGPGRTRAASGGALEAGMSFSLSTSAAAAGATGSQPASPGGGGSGPALSTPVAKAAGSRDSSRHSFAEEGGSGRHQFYAAAAAASAVSPSPRGGGFASTSAAAAGANGVALTPRGLTSPRVMGGGLPGVAAAAAVTSVPADPVADTIIELAGPGGIPAVASAHLAGIQSALCEHSARYGALVDAIGVDAVKRIVIMSSADISGTGSSGAGTSSSALTGQFSPSYYPSSSGSTTSAPTSALTTIRPYGLQHASQREKAEASSSASSSSSGGGGAGAAAGASHSYESHALPWPTSAFDPDLPPHLGAALAWADDDVTAGIAPPVPVPARRGRSASRRVLLSPAAAAAAPMPSLSGRASPSEGSDETASLAQSLETQAGGGGGGGGGQLAGDSVVMHGSRSGLPSSHAAAGASAAASGLRVGQLSSFVGALQPPASSKRLSSSSSSSALSPPSPGSVSNSIISPRSSSLMLGGTAGSGGGGTGRGRYGSAGGQSDAGSVVSSGSGGGGRPSSAGGASAASSSALSAAVLASRVPAVAQFTHATRYDGAVTATLHMPLPPFLTGGGGGGAGSSSPHSASASSSGRAQSAHAALQHWKRRTTVGIFERATRETLRDALVGFADAGRKARQIGLEQ